MTPRARKIVDETVEFLLAHNSPSHPDHMSREAPRTSEVVRLRHICWWKMQKRYPHLTNRKIGQEFGGWDHSTIWHGTRVGEKKFKQVQEDYAAWRLDQRTFSERLRDDIETILFREGIPHKTRQSVSSQILDQLKNEGLPL